MAIDKEKLLASRLKTETVSIPDVGDVVVRALTRAEVLQFNDQNLDAAAADRHMVAAALVEPALTLEEVAAWQSASSPMEIQPVVEAVMRLSGMEVDALKKAYQQFLD